MKNGKCGACAKFIGRTGIVSCPKCSGQYHGGCVGVSAGAVIPKDWVCPDCQRFLPRDNRSDTPVKGLPGKSSSPAVAAAPLATDRPAAAAQAVITQPGSAMSASTADIPDSPVPFDGEDMGRALVELKRFIGAEFFNIRRELKEFRDEFHEMRAHLSDFNARMDRLEGRVDAIEKQVVNGAASAATRVLEEAVATLQMELNDRDQELLSNDVQVTNVPEEPGESAAGLATRICAKLGVELDVRDVVSAHRVGRTREAGRPRPFVLRLARRAIKDELLRGARTRRGATTEGLGLAGAPQRFYVNERLTSANRQLFQRAREAARTAAWRFVWTRDGRILARKSEGQPTHRVRRLSDLQIFLPAEAQTGP
jgi:hypothetical protein